LSEALSVTGRSFNPQRKAEKSEVGGGKKRQGEETKTKLQNKKSSKFILRQYTPSLY
jgi:hypothetical protein